MTPLHYAAYSNFSAVISLLISRGGDPNARDLLGRTPLHHAAEQHSTAAAYALILAGASLDTQDVYKRTPLIIAATKGNLEIVEIFENFYIQRLKRVSMADKSHAFMR